MNARGLRLGVYSLILALAGAACDADGSTPVTTTEPNQASVTVAVPTTDEPSTTATARPPSTTATSTTVTSTTEILSEYQQAIRFIWAFDPVRGDPDELAAALDITGVFTGLEFPLLIEEGSAAVNNVLFKKLAEPSSWSIPILVEMKEYGMPSGSIDSPKPWADAALSTINETLTMSAEASYGPCAQLMIDLNWQHITETVQTCAAEGCNWGSVWYSVPETLTRPIGHYVDDTSFKGTVTVTSDTGAGNPYIVTAELLDRWVITERAVPTEMPDDSAPNDCRPPAG